MSYAIITGASSGLGEHFARRFANDGIPTILVARREDRLRALQADLKKLGNADVQVLPLDLSRPESPKTILEFAKNNRIGIQYLVNNAGFGLSGKFWELDRSRQLEMIQLNVTALTELTYLVLPEMLKNKKGRILNIGSTAGFQPGPFMAVYYASKAFVVSLSEALWYETKGTGVSVTVSCPGATATEFAGVANIGNSRLFKMGALSAEQVTREAYEAMKAGRRMAIHGMKNRAGVQMLRVGPRSAVLGIVAKMNQSS